MKKKIKLSILCIMLCTSILRGQDINENSNFQIEEKIQKIITDEEVQKIIIKLKDSVSINFLHGDPYLLLTTVCCL